MSKLSRLIACIAAVGALLFTSTMANAATCYAITQGNRILTFDSATPGVVPTDLAISGINPAYSVVGIALRTTTQTFGAANPGVGSLWGIAYNGTDFFLCVIDPATGVASQIGGILNLDDSANADGFGFGFDPSTDRFRFISVENNYAIDPNTATVTQQTSFPGFPAQSGAAFSTTSFGGSNNFYNVSRQSSPRTLQTTTNIAGGSLTQINPGGLGAGLNAPIGLAIADNLFLLTSSDDNELYSVNRSAGTLTSLGLIGGAPTIRGLAIVPSSFPAPFSVTAKIKGKKKIVTSKSRYTLRGTATSGAGIDQVQFRVGKGAFKTAKGTTKWSAKIRLKPGINKVAVRAVGGNDVTSSEVRAKIDRRLADRSPAVSPAR